MPELAEVEFYRKAWDSGLGQRVLSVKLHSSKRVFRQVPVKALERSLIGAVFKESEARGKQLLFRFSGDAWLGLHLGMTGKLRSAPANFRPGKHDHLVLYQQGRALVLQEALFQIPLLTKPFQSPEQAPRL